MRGKTSKAMFSGENLPRAMAPLPLKLGYTPTGVDLNRRVDFTPDVPLYPTAYAITMPTGSVGKVYSSRAAYFAPMVQLPQALKFYHSAMAVNGWQKHPDFEIYRKGPAQMRLRLKQTASGTLVEYISGRQMIHDGAWDYAFSKNKMRGI